MNTSSWSESLKGLADDLSREREQREMSVNLEYGISDVTSGFSHFCLRGLRTLISIVREASTEPRMVQNLQVLQRKDSSLRLVPLIMREFLVDGPRTETGRDGRQTIPVGNSGSTVSEEEEELALRLLQGICLIDPPSRIDAAERGAIRVLLHQLPQYSGVAARAACLEVLLTLQMGWEGRLARHHMRMQQGCTVIADVLQRKADPLDARRRCVEFLVLQLTHLCLAVDAADATGESESYSSMSAEIRGALGEEVYAVLEAQINLKSHDRVQQLNQRALSVIEIIDAKPGI